MLTINPDALPEIYRAVVEDIFEGRGDVAGRVNICVANISSLAEERARDGLSGHVHGCMPTR